MARTKLEISKKELQAVVTKLESEQTFANPSALWKAVEETEWAKSQKPRPLMAGVVYQRAKEMKIKFVTKPGKRGRRAGEGFPNRGGPRKARAEKMVEFESTFDALRAKTPERWQKWVDKAEKGSIRAAMNLFCVECVGYEVPEVKKCTCIGCPHYPHRPYKMKPGETEATDDGTEPPEEIEEAA